MKAVGVPVAPVLAAYGRVSIGGRFFCLWHNDERPGGHPSAHIMRDDPASFFCFSCWQAWGAADIIAKITGCTVQEANERAHEIGATAPTPPAVSRTRRPSLSPSTLEDELRRERERARTYAVDPVDAFCEARGWPMEIATFARESWGWQGGYGGRAGGRVVMPHCDRDGNVRGVKRRLPPN